MSARKEGEMLKALALSSVIQPLLRGHKPYVQGGALADLMSIWLAGHIVPGDEEATATARKAFFDDWCETVWKLVPVNEHQIETLMEAKP